MKMKAIDRLYEYLAEKSLKPTAIEKEIGISNGYLSAQKKRNADMGEGALNKIIDYFRDINPNWLLTGDGPMLREDKMCAKPYSIPNGPDKSLVVAEQSPIHTDHGIYEKLYKDKDEETKKLIEEIGSLKEKIRHLEADRLNVENQDVSNVSTKKSRKSNPPVTSAIARSKKL